MNFKKIDKLAEKKKWMDRFRRAYSGELKPETDKFYTDNVSFLVAQEENRELGFVRITDKTYRFNQFTSKSVWSLTDGYIKPSYRNKGVLKKLIRYSIDHHNVRAMYIETTRFRLNQSYYFDLGFTKFYTVSDGQFTWAFQEDIWQAVEQLNANNS